jgi:hypothetical protein
LTVRRYTLATAGMALALLLALAVASSLALARESDGRQPPGGSGSDRRGAWALMAWPLGWLRHSRESFQWMMHLLAERSARLQSPPQSPPAPDAYPGAEQPEPDLPFEAPDRREPDGPWPDERPADRVERRRTGEAEAAQDRPGTRVRDWHTSRSPACRRAGQPVEAGGWYVVAPGDTLRRIALVHYGSDQAWRRILHANRGAIPDSQVIYACQRLFIPPRRGERPACDEPETDPPQRGCHRGGCDEPGMLPARPVCRPSPQQPDRPAPGGCSRCGAGLHAGERGWR